MNTRGWKLSVSDFDNIWTSGAVGHNSSLNDPLFTMRDLIFELGGSEGGILTFFEFFRFGRNFFAFRAGEKFMEAKTCKKIIFYSKSFCVFRNFQV